MTTTTARAAIIVNPISGTRGRRDVVADRVTLAHAVARQHGVAATVTVSERPGHARDLALAAVADGVTTVIAWGGDGTVNEAGSALAFGSASLGIVPSGSGNGLARELGIPLQPGPALELAFRGGDRLIDCGELDGHLFFNIAGVGLDARVAHQFAALGLRRRGFRRYLEITAREFFRYEGDEHVVVVDDMTLRRRALLIAIANARQYGNGALIAPQASLEDGRLDVVVVDHRSPWRSLAEVPRVFMGQIARVRGVTMLRGERIEITSGAPVAYHVDGEPFVGAAVVRARAHRGGLRVRVPRAVSR